MNDLGEWRRAPSWTCICAALLLISATTAAQQHLQASDMRSVISGNTLSGKTERGADFHVYHSPDGRTSGQARLAYYDVGTWRVTNDGRYCRQWTSWREGATDCFEMFEDGEGRYRMKAINYHYESTFRMREGDPENLEGRI